MFFDKRQTLKQTCAADRRGMSTTGTMLLMIIIIVLAGSMYLQWGSSIGGSAPSVSNIATAHSSVESFRFDTNVQLSAAIDTDELQSRDDAERIRSVLQLVSISTSNSSLPTQLTTTLRLEGQTQTGSSSSRTASFSLLTGDDQQSTIAAVDFRKVNGSNFLRPSRLPTFDAFDTTELEGRWFALSPTTKDTFLSFMPQLEGLSGLASARSTLAGVDVVSPLFTEGVLRIENTTKTELRSGAPAYLFELNINPDAISSYRSRVQNQLPEEGSERTRQFVDRLESDTFRDRLALIQEQLDELRVWVDRERNLVRRVVLEAAVTPDEVDSVFGLSGVNAAGVASSTMSIDIGLSGYNEPVDVSAPEAARSIQSWLNSQEGVIGN